MWYGLKKKRHARHTAGGVGRGERRLTYYKTSTIKEAIMRDDVFV